MAVKITRLSKDNNYYYICIKYKDIAFIMNNNKKESHKSRKDFLKSSFLFGAAAVTGVGVLSSFKNTQDKD